MDNMSRLSEAEKFSDIFHEPGAVYLDGTTEQISALEAQVKTLNYCCWVDANQVIADTLTKYTKHNSQNETRMLYANIVLGLTNAMPPNRQDMLRWHDILWESFKRNGETAIFVNNAHKLKKDTLECFLADGKYFRGSSRRSVPRTAERTDSFSMRYEYDSKSYFVILVPPGTELPPMPGSVINHVRSWHIENLLNL